MTTPPSSEVERREPQPAFVELLRRYTGNLSRVAPKHIEPDAFIGLAAAYIGRSKDLVDAAQRNPQALIHALRECAALGHVVGKDSYVLVPFKDSKAPGGKSIVGIEVYKGVVERMYRSGGVQSVHAMVVRHRDDFDWFGPDRVPRHAYDIDAGPETRGALRGVYAYARMATGGVQVAWLNRHDVLKYRLTSRSGDAFWGPAWPDEGPWTVDMWRKTALHRLEAWVPTSAAYRWEMSTVGQVREDAALGVAVPPDMAGGAPDVVDAELVPERGTEGAEWPATAEPGSGGAR